MGTVHLVYLVAAAISLRWHLGTKQAADQAVELWLEITKRF